MKTRVLIASAGVGLSAIVLSVMIHGQDAGQVPTAFLEGATSLLQSRLSQYLSGSGRSALMRITGLLPAPTLTGAGPAVSVLPFAGHGVMVNNPALDIEAMFDITTESETNVGAFTSAIGTNVIVAFNWSTGFATARSGMAWSLSTDNGATFTQKGHIPTTASGSNAGDPGVAVDKQGNFYVSGLAMDFAAGFPSTIAINKSTDGGNTFGMPVYVPLPLVPLGTFGFSDKPFITADISTAATSGNIYVTFTEFENGPTVNGSAIMFSRSIDHGATFSTPITLSAPHSFNQGSQPVIGPSGEIYVAWEEFFMGFGGPSIMVAKSTNGGVSFTAPVKAADFAPIGFATGILGGNLRVNSFPRIAMGNTKDVYIVYNGNPLVGGADGADVFLIKSTDGGRSFSFPIRVNDDTTKNDQFFPAVAVSSDGVIEVLWYDRRGDRENNLIGVFDAKSTNGGVSFLANSSLSGITFPPATGFDPIVIGNYMGDYNDVKAGVSAAGLTSTYYAAWTDCRVLLTTNGGHRPDQDVFFGKP